MPKNAASRTARRRRRNSNRRRTGAAARTAWARSYDLSTRVPIPKQPIHKFKQIVIGASIAFPSSALSTYNGNASYIAQSSSTEVNWGFAFALSDLSQSSTFTALYDQYRLMCVRIHLRPQCSMQVQSLVTYSNVTAATVVPTPTGNIYTAVDLDDNVAPTASGLRQFDTCKITSVMQPKTITHVIYPRCNLGTFSALSSTTTGNSMAPYGTWLDVGSPGIPHYGFKVSVDQGVANFLQIWEIDCEYFFEFKNVR